MSSKIATVGTVDRYLFTGDFPETVKKKAILPSPLSFAIAAESPHYVRKENLMFDFAEVLRKDVAALGSLGYEYVQLTESFLPNERFINTVRKEPGLVLSFNDAINTVFRDFPKRSAVYLHSGDASAFIPGLLESNLSDIGFDFNTSLKEVSVAIDKNLILGLQNTTRKLPDDILAKEPELLATRAKAALGHLILEDSVRVSLAPSQDFDGLQTYPQAERRVENLAAAVSLLRKERG